MGQGGGTKTVNDKYFRQFEHAQVRGGRARGVGQKL
jgi:hypothetical protein